MKHNASWTSDVDSKLHIAVSDESLLSRYLFGTKTAEFFVCSACGVPVAAISVIDGNQYAVVNVGAIDNPGNLSVTETGTDFDGEGADDRLERRKRNWICQVDITALDA